MDLIVFAIPVFFLFIGIERLAAYFKKKEVYRLNDAITDIGCGVVDQVISALVKTFTFGMYVLVYKRYAQFEIPANSIWSVIGLFILIDFMYYWLHRFSHRINVLWAGHIVHHSSQEYNLAVALRQGFLQSLFASVYYLPLAWLGFPPILYLSLGAAHTLSQFWFHTQLIRKMGPLEWILNTPSHHRVHHGRNPKYIDKNYAGALIIWDRMFGTFQPEEEEPEYGLTKNLHSFNPIWAQFHNLWDLFKAANHAKSWRDKLKLWFMPTGWRPAGYTEAGSTSYEKYNPSISNALKIYLCLQFAFLIIGVSFFLNHVATVNRFLMFGGAALILGSLISFGALFERKKWATGLETTRLLVIVFAAYFMFF